MGNTDKRLEQSFKERVKKIREKRDRVIEFAERQYAADFASVRADYLKAARDVAEEDMKTTGFYDRGPCFKAFYHVSQEEEMDKRRW